MKIRNRQKLLQRLLALLFIAAEVLLFVFLPVAWADVIGQDAFASISAPEAISRPWLEKIPGIVFESHQAYLIVFPYLVLLLGLLFYMAAAGGKRQRGFLIASGILSCILAFVFRCEIGIRCSLSGVAVTSAGNTWPLFFCLFCAAAVIVLSVVAAKKPRALVHVPA